MRPSSGPVMLRANTGPCEPDDGWKNRRRLQGYPVFKKNILNVRPEQRYIKSGENQRYKADQFKLMD
jgi:hypothetical protein